ncbi:MAG: MgtC/SapB family protein [Planctomycetota bacterium]
MAAWLSESNGGGGGGGISLPDFSNIASQLVNVEVTPLLLALVLSGTIGMERELHGRPAGLRTHVLVCLAATVLMQSSTVLPQLAGDDATIVFDPQRLAAGIVTGIGFLGAAAVVRAGEFVRGVTTGATVWSVAGLGVVIGQGAYGLAIWMTALTLFALIVLDVLPSRTVVYRRLSVRSDGRDLPGLMKSVKGILIQNRSRLQEISGGFGREADGGYELKFHVRCRDPLCAPLILERVRTLPGVNEAHWSGWVR